MPAKKEEPKKDSNGLPMFLAFCGKLPVDFDSCRSTIIFGPNGSGKTTFFNWLKGKHAADWDFLSYAEKMDAILGTKGGIEIGHGIKEIEKEEADLDAKKGELGVSKILKKYGLGSANARKLGLEAVSAMLADETLVPKPSISKADFEALHDIFGESPEKISLFASNHEGQWQEQASCGEVHLRLHPG